MSIEQVEALTPIQNTMVIRMPGRRFPGVFMQGDTFAIMADEIRELREPIASAAGPRSADAAAALEHLECVQRLYEETLREHGIPLPYETL